MSPLELKNPDDPSLQEGDAQAPKKKFDPKLIIKLVSGLIMLGIIVTPVWLGFTYGSDATITQTAVTQLQNDNLLLDTQIKKEKAKGNIDITSKQQKIDQILKLPTRVAWSEIIQELERVTHDATDNSDDALFSYTSYNANADGTISVSGFTNSYPAIADLIEAIEASPRFEHVKFSSTSKSTENVVSLSLTFGLEKPEKVEPETPPASPVAAQPKATS